MVSPSRRNIKTWMSDIASGKIAVPAFQRGEAWKIQLSADMLTSILKNRPIGVLYVLSLSRPHCFDSFGFEGSEVGESVKEQILDGQQRLRALWASFTFKKFPSDRYMFCTKEKSGKYKDQYSKVIVVKKIKKNKEIIENPTKQRRKGWIPVHILNPMDMNNSIDEWLKGSRSVGVQNKWRNIAKLIKKNILAVLA